MTDNKPSLSHTPHRSGGATRVGVIIGIVAVAVAAWGIISRVQAKNKLNELTQELNIIPVNVVHPHGNGNVEELVLPGDVRAWADAPVYARTSGYLKRWLVDIGTPVKAGQVLAEIDTPEVDQQLAQARADYGTAQANNALAQSTAARWKDLLATESVSQQEADEKNGDAAAKNALLASSQANVNRLRQLQGFKNISAPFNGVITARNVDVGDLINPGAAGQRELFHIVDTHQLRIYVQIPQSYVSNITADMSADLHFAELPGKTFQAKVVRTANAIDPSTRTMLVQLVTDNAKGELLPGSYAEVHFKLPMHADALRVPDNTLLFRGTIIQVASVGDKGKVSLRTITLGRDFGKEVEVLTGLTDKDALIINPPDSITDGDVVRPVEAKPDQPDAAKGGAAK